jgi:hypothetical protein
MGYKFGAFRRTLTPPRTALVFLAAAGVLYIRLLYQADYFPPFHGGEQEQPLLAAQGAFDSTSLKGLLVDGYSSYNKGYAWALAPLYGMFGYDGRILTYAMPVFFAAFLGSMFILYRAAYPRASFLAYIPISVMAVLCDCLRRTKWHTIAYIPPLAILVFFMPEWRPGLGPRARTAARIAGLAGLALACYLYFGCFLYAGPFLVLATLLGGRAGWWERGRRAALWGIGAFLALLAAAFAHFCSVNPLWSERIHGEMGYLAGVLTREGLMDRWTSFVDYYWGGMLSPPYLVMYLAGLAVLCSRARRRDPFAIVVLVMYGILWGFQLVLEPVNNPDQLNWSMIPALLVILAGADFLVALVRRRVPWGGTLAFLLVLVVAWREIYRYPDYNREYANEFWIQMRDPNSEAALVLRMVSEDRSGQARYYLPSPSVPLLDGGFAYDFILGRPDFAEAISRVIFFNDEADLRRKILLGPRDKWAVVYLSAMYAPDGIGLDHPETSTGRYLDMDPEVVSPYSDVYRSEFVVRKFKVRPAQLLPRVRSGASTNTRAQFRPYDSAR